MNIDIDGPRAQSARDLGGRAPLDMRALTAAGTLLATLLVSFATVSGTAWALIACPLLVAVALVAGLGLDWRPRDLLYIAALGGYGLWALVSGLWTASSGGWSAAGPRYAVIAAAGVAVLTVARRGYGQWMVLGLCAGVILVDAASVGAHLLPGIISGGAVPHVNRLEWPLGYWNALGGLSAAAAVSTLAFTRSPYRILAGAAGAGLVFEAVAVYLTFSRGALAVLVIGLALAAYLERDRLDWLARVVAGGAAPLLTVVILTGDRSVIRAFPGRHARHVDHWVPAAIILLLAALGAFLVIAGAPMAARLVSRLAGVRRGMLIGVTAAVAVVLVLGAAGVLPGVDRFLGSFEARSPHFKRGDLNQRLASLSLNGRASIWSDAWHDFTAHPVAGVGAGGFEAPLIHRTVQTTPLRPHSLELGALAELGFIGGALVLVSLALPLLAIRAASRIEPLAPAVAGTFVGLLAQATLDWTWDVAAVALLGTLSGALLIAWSRAETAPRREAASP